MKHSMAIKMILRRYGLKKSQVAAKFGKTVYFLYDSVEGDGIGIDHVVDLLDDLGYQLVFRPKGSGPLPEWSYPIRWSDYQTEQTEE